MESKRKIVNTPLPKLLIIFGALMIVFGLLFAVILFGKNTSLTAYGIGLMIVGSSFIIYTPSTTTKRADSTDVSSGKKPAIRPRVNLAFNLILCLCIFMTVLSLHSFNSPLDAYVSVFALDYFVCTAIIKPNKIHHDFTIVALLFAFAAIITMKFLEIIL